ncbi:hypothetical protein GGTG_13695 [Gaeumannomyces tritici R3-111a-1]|uniref:Uncharacterized protein n=1 Tax=Gaeumannomyces tritici (strain R3-111a-1) TaxID=644352 RepID=J3PJK9_GAET3|nr:hypothetical protein GGTG_13695 [Gaeumannomyces tritici R3-111a-1]EJT68730.1 hypothetical protein GGTG_13695 [Gaeumannomyces tritici R3-111a-1]
MDKFPHHQHRRAAAPTNELSRDYKPYLRHTRGRHAAPQVVDLASIKDYRLAPRHSSPSSQSGPAPVWKAVRDRQKRNTGGAEMQGGTAAQQSSEASIVSQLAIAPNGD